MKNFDTLKSAKMLISSGMQEQQAEAIAELLSQSRDYDFSRLATKEQVSNLEKNMKQEMLSLKNEMKAMISEAHTLTIKWMVGSMIAFSGIVFAGIQLLR